MVQVIKKIRTLSRGRRLSPRQLSDDEVPETVMKDSIVVSKEMFMEERMNKLGSSI